MKKNRILSASLLLLLLTLVLSLTLLTACRGGGNETEDTPAESAAPTDGPAGDPTEPVTDAPTEPASETPTEPATDPAVPPETEPVTPPETEPETEYDIKKPVVYLDLNPDYISVRAHGAVGDGKTDDTEAVRAALLDAYNHNKVCCFPAGTYLITSTITLPKNDGRTLHVVGDGAALLGADTLDGPILDADMKYNFFMYNMDFVHNGQGSCVDALFLVAQYCRFAADAENASDLVVFHGSDCRVIECSFDTACPDVWALSYLKQKDEISINDHIVDNVFRGAGKGLRVGDGEYKDDGRCEGLKINGNYFYNVGAEQIRVSEILHVNIAHNVMKGCTGSAIILNQLGHGADGVYINDNRIEPDAAALACIATETGADNYVSSVNINNNVLRGAQYGIMDEAIITRAFIRENTFVGQSVSGYANSKKQIRDAYTFFDNLFDEPEGVCSLTLKARGKMIFARNSLGGTNDYNDFFKDTFPTDQISADISGNDNPTRRPEGTPGEPNAYEGEEDIGREEPREDESETEMNVPVISPDPVDAPMFGSEGVKGNDPYLMVPGTELTVHFAATARFNGITINCPSWGNSVGSIHAKLYVWYRNYERTLSCEPVAEADWVDFPDGNLNTISFDALPAGEYALVLTTDDRTPADDAVGVWILSRTTTYQTIYKNGVLTDGQELNLATIHYTETPETTLWPASPEKATADRLSDVAILSQQPCEPEMYGKEGKVGEDSLDMRPGTEVTAHFAATARFDKLTIICPSWGNSIGSIHAKLYRWDKNYDQTLAGEPIAAADWIDFPDNAHNVISFDVLPAGEYALVLTVDDSIGDDHVGLWVQTRKRTDMKVYKNGVLADGLELNHATIHYVETPETMVWQASPDQ